MIHWYSDSAASIPSDVVFDAINRDSASTIDGVGDVVKNSDVVSSDGSCVVDVVVLESFEIPTGSEVVEIKERFEPQTAWIMETATNDLNEDMLRNERNI